MALSPQQTAQKNAAEWFIISGDLCIRLLRPITLGVDANGILQLNSTQASGRWLTVEVAQDGNSIAITWLHPALELRRVEPQQSEQKLTQGTLLRLPHNEVYLSRSMQRGRRSQLIEVVQLRKAKISHPATAARSSELAKKVAAPIGPIPEAKPKLDSVSTAEPTSKRAENIPATSNRPQNNSRWPKQLLASAAGVGAIAIIAWQFYAPGKQDSAQTDLVFVQTPTTTNEPVIAESASPSIPETNKATTIELLPTPEPVGAGQPSERATPTNPATADALPSDNLEKLMAEAQVLFDKGYYTWPQPSAADILDELLGLDPTHDEALALRDRMAALLITKARQTYADGFVEPARDQLKAVLAFHRNHGPAVELLIKWDEARLNW